MNKYIYIRVSSKDQNEARQLEDVEKLNIPKENVYIDKQSGKDFDRPEYQRLISTIQEGDIVYFHSIDRMGRSYDMIIEEWNRITKIIKADIVILDMPLLDTTTKNSDLTGKLIADIVLQLLSYVAEKERENIKRRQAEGIAIAVKEGKFRKKDIDMELFAELQNEVYIHKTMTVVEACDKLNITKRTWYDKINGRKKRA
jgi:DNA invertase Pin-like site-specific DNA recombinase